MAFADNTTYTGKDAVGFYSKAILTGDVKSMIRVMPNVKSKEKIARLDLTNIVQEDDCTFTDLGTTTLSQKTLEVCPLKVNLEFCTTQFEANYLSEQLRPGNTGEVMPASFEEYLLEQIAVNTSATLEDLLWNGDTAGSPATVCDGFRKKFLADSAVVDVTGTTLSASNILTEIAKVYAAIPNAIMMKPDLRIFISNAAFKFYSQAIAAGTGNGGAYFIGEKPLNYLGIELVVAPYLPANEMVAAQLGNLWMGTDLVNDFDDVQILNMYRVLGSPTARFTARFKFGVEYGVGEEIVWYH